MGQNEIQLWGGAALVIFGLMTVLVRVLGGRVAKSIRAADEITPATDPTSLFNVGKGNEGSGSGLNRFRRKLDTATASGIKKRKSGKRLTRTLERSGSKLRAGEFVIIVLSIATVIFVCVYLFRGLFAAVVAGFLALFLGRYYLNRKISKRQSAFAEQLPDFLQMMATNLRAGQSLPQAVSSVAAEARTPVREELQRVLLEQRIGRDFTAAFKDLADRMESKDMEWVVSAIDINRSVGGDLATILGRVEATIRARNRVRGQVDAMSAEGKLSGVILVALPPGLLFFVQMINPGYLEPMLNSFQGKALLGLAALMLATGAFWLSRLSKFVY